MSHFFDCPTCQPFLDPYSSTWAPWSSPFSWPCQPLLRSLKANLWHKVSGKVIRKKSSQELTNGAANALKDLYNSANGVGWINSSNWNVGTPCSSNWFGVSCDPSLSYVYNLYAEKKNFHSSFFESSHDFYLFKALWFSID